MPVLGGSVMMPGARERIDPWALSFRRLRTSDLALMHRWLNAAHVIRWWYGEGTSYREIEEKYLPRIEGREAVRPYAILIRGTPIGYIQGYPISDEDDEEYARLVDVEASAGIDLFIGEEGYLHKGLGRHILERFLTEDIFSDPEVEVCVIGPEPNNTSAIRAYEKAGFRYFKTIQVPGEPEPEYLMRLTRREFEGGGLG